MAVGFAFQPRDLVNLPWEEVRRYERHCRKVVADAPGQLAYLNGRLDELRRGYGRKRWLTFGGAATSAGGMAGIALLTWSGLIAVAGGTIALLSLDGFAADARERQLLAIDYRNLNESLVFCREELQRIAAERRRRGAGP